MAFAVPFPFATLSIILGIFAAAATILLPVIGVPEDAVMIVTWVFFGAACIALACGVLVALRAPKQQDSE